MRLSIGWVSVCLLAAISVGGCADSSATKNQPEETGTLMLPLVSYGPSGAKYQLRNANFQITPYYLFYGTAGAAGSGTKTINVSSETDPSADAIELDLESGYYYVNLNSGWSIEKVENGVATAVPAQLLSSQTQYLYVSPRSSSWVKYQFGLGERSVWFNGKATIDMDVYETPSQYYGGGGAGGIGSTPINAAGAPAYSSVAGAAAY